MTVRSALRGSSLIVPVLMIPTTAGADVRAAHAATKAPCVAKPVTVAGSPGTQFCGPATAKVRVGGKTYSFEKGFCAYDPQNKLALQLSLGTDVPVLGAGKPEASHFSS
jgi:hypothetical protein